MGSPISVPSFICESLQSTDAMTSSRSLALCILPSSAAMMWLFITILRTVILFCVRVPVLSEQMTDTEPRPSTAWSFLMMAFSLDIFCVPKERTMVTIEDRASGIAATASAMANISESITVV